MDFLIETSIENNKKKVTPRLATGNESDKDNKYSFQYTEIKLPSEKANEKYWKNPEVDNCFTIETDINTKPPKDKIPIKP